MAIDAGDGHILGLKSDGTVVVAGKAFYIDDCGEDNVSSWRNIRLPTNLSPDLILTLQRGDKGDFVKALQQRLIDLGYLSGSADGDFGRKSEAAVKEFQQANGLEANGVADNATQQILFSDDAVSK